VLVLHQVQHIDTTPDRQAIVDRALAQTGFDLWDRPSKASDRHRRTALVAPW
jgi:hypothetical protein